MKYDHNTYYKYDATKKHNWIRRFLTLYGSGNYKHNNKKSSKK